MGAWAVKSEISGAAYGPARRQARGAQGQRLPGRRADDERRVDARRLRARRRRHGGDAHPRCRRHHRRQSACEYFCLSGGSHTSQQRAGAQPVSARLLGRWLLVGAAARWWALAKSKWRSAATRAARYACPARTRGCYGMKATHGLVPYTGAMPIEATIDHLGSDDRDGRRQRTAARGDRRRRRHRSAPVRRARRQIHRALGRGVAGMRIGVVTRGVRPSESASPTSTRRCARARRSCASLGAIVDELSIPMHLDGPAIWTPIALEGLQAQMMHGNGMGFNWRRPVHDQPARRARQLARACQRTVAHAEDIDAGRRLLHPSLPRPFLCEGAEPLTPAAPRLRRRTVALRPAADADVADEGHAAAAVRMRRSRSSASAASRCCRIRARSTLPAIRL